MKNIKLITKIIKISIKVPWKIIKKRKTFFLNKYSYMSLMFIKIINIFVTDIETLFKKSVQGHTNNLNYTVIIKLRKPHWTKLVLILQ